MKLSGNTVLITGGGTGIGLAMAEAFLAAGSEIVLCGRRDTKLLEVQKKHPQVHVKACDVSSTVDRRTLVKWVGEKFPAINVLVNNAGIQRDIDFTKGVAELESGDSEIEINLEAPIVLSGMFVPLLTGKPGATIINVTSGLGFVPAAKMPVYSATKAGLHAFSMALRFQLAKVGIEVVEIVPPAVDTELNPEGRQQRGGFKAGLSAEDFLAPVVKDLEAGKTEIGFGFSASMLRASRDELDQRFQQMNSRG